MNIEKLIINNYKAIESTEINLQPGMNLLVGDNGVGKTSILEAIVVALGGLFTNVAGVSKKNIAKDDIRISIDNLGDAATGVTYHTPVAIECQMRIDDIVYQWNRSRVDSENSHTKIDNREICKWMNTVTNQSDSILPLLSFQSAARVWRVKRGDFGKEIKKKLNDRRCGYIGCLDYSLDVKVIQEWCLKMELAAFQKRKLITEYELFKCMISTFMQNINESETAPEIYFSSQLNEMVYIENGEEMPISKLSAGYQSLLWMIMDLAYRTAILNPQGIKKLEQISGIVIIDEIDMHLHPKWQWNILRALEVTFPNVQFIIATHSPIVISSCKDGNLISVGDDREVNYQPGAYGYSVEDVLELRQGSSSKPRNIEILNDKLERALNKDDYNTAEEIIAEMKAQLGDSHSEVIRAIDLLEMNRWIEEN